MHQHPPEEGDNFTCFDIWCAGLGQNTFKNIADDLLSPRLLLDHSYGFHDVFNVEESSNRDLDALTKELRKSQRQLMLPLRIRDEGEGENGDKGDDGDEEDEDMDVDVDE